MQFKEIEGRTVISLEIATSREDKPQYEMQIEISKDGIYRFNIIDCEEKESGAHRERFRVRYARKLWIL